MDLNTLKNKATAVKAATVQERVDDIDTAASVALTEIERLVDRAHAIQGTPDPNLVELDQIKTELDKYVGLVPDRSTNNSTSLKARAKKLAANARS